MKPRLIPPIRKPLQFSLDKLPHVLLIAVVLAFFVGCSAISARRAPEDQPPPDAASRAEAVAVLTTLAKRNANLKNFKGTGKFKVWQKGRLNLSEQIAWIGSDNNRISIVILIGRYPAVKMASDGKWFYYYEVGQEKPIYRRFAASKANLKRIISIPIQIGDVLDLLSGRVPIREHQSAVLEALEAGQGYVLVLKKRWWGVTEKIYVDETKSQAYQVEFFNRSGALTYRAEFNEMQMVKDYRVPARLNITNAKDASFELDINRFWVDVKVNPSMFVLEPPE
jgi:hypothetical protein